jgi:phage gp36-like protein
MSFFSIEEMRTVAPLEFVEIVKGEDDQVLTDIIDETVSLISTNIGSYYDVATIFAAAGGDRNKTILMYLKDIVWYKLKKRRKPGANLTDEDYNEAMKWLEEVSTGKRRADLPPKQEDLDGDGISEDVPFMKLGGNKSYQNGW